MTTTIGRLSTGPNWNWNKLFLSETINLIERKLYMNNHCMVPYKIYIFVLIGKT